jgi:signal peptide peptidase SppA
MTIRNRAIYAPQGPLAITPQAYGVAYDVALAADGQAISCIATRGEIAIVSVRGPLMQHPDGCFRSYNEIQCDVETVLAARPKAVVLSISSPGGLVTGCFELASTLRTLAAAADVPLIAYVDGQACSAAYALACGCSRIVAPATADVGSIGVIGVLADATAQAAAAGMRFAVISSGKRKADGNPLTALTDDAIAAKQAHVDELAGHFFEHVAKARGMSAATVRGLEAATFTGAKALRLHLVDEVQNLDQLLASLNQPASASQATAAEKPQMSVKATLQAVLDDDKASDEDKEQAKKALAALDDGDDDKAAEDGDDDKAADDADDDKAAEDGDEDKAAGGPPGTASTAAAPAAASADAPVTRAEFVALSARLERGEDNAKRKRIMATRPDLSKDQIKALKGVPTVALAAALGAIPKVKAPKAGLTAAAIAGAQTTPGATPVDPNATGRYSPERAKQRQRMGLSAVVQDTPLVTEGGTTKFSVVTAVAAGKVGAK